jgi:inward rectifier potassium channel
VSEEERPVAPPDPKREIDRDLGLGTRVIQQSQRRFLNRDGSFTVRREGLSFFRSLSLYHWLLTVSWPRFFLATGGAFMAYNTAFALLYFLCGPGALLGAEGVTTGERLADAFFFSVQTAATIGYGHVSPHGLAANLLVTLESFFGLLGLALATGVLFSRFARPHARILFSETAVMAPYRDISGLMFRVANERSNELLEVRATVTLSWRVSTPQGLVRRFHELALERREVVFFPLHWVVVHPVDKDSPLWGVTREQFDESDAEVLVLLEGVDETFEQVVHARTSYKPDEVAWGARFTDIYLKRPDAPMAIDMRRLHETEPAALPPPGRQAAAAG